MDELLLLLILLFGVPGILLVIALVSISSLKRRVGVVERQLAELQAAGWSQPASPKTVPVEDAVPQAEVPWAEDMSVTEDAPVRPWAWLDEPVSAEEAESQVATLAKAAPPPVPATAAPTVMPTPAPTPMPVRPSAQAAAQTPDIAEKILGGIKRWFTQGNVPVKVGMLVMLAGVMALLRYAGQQGWVHLPIELRLAGVAAIASVAAVLGWQQRIRRPQFALAVQGGAIGALLLTIFAASKLYGVLPLGVAFVLSVILIAAAGVMAVLQDSRTLAILATLAGFCAPLWLSSGSGNHVALFSYYAILNLAIFGVVWLKPWRVLMLLGFTFTWGIGVLWGVLAYKPQFYASAQPFLALFFVLYLLMPLLHARKQPPGRGELVNGSLLFATPLVAFSLQAGLMSGGRLPLALVAVGVAAVYALLGAWLRGHARCRVLFDAYVLLAVGFVTLAIPLAFSAKVTGALLAVEGALLLWFGLRHQRALPLWSGLGLQLVAGMTHLFARFTHAQDMIIAEWGEQALTPPVPVLNSLTISALLLALMGFASAWLLWRHRRQQLSSVMYVWGLLCWTSLWMAEIFDFAPSDQWREWILVLVAVTGWLAAEILRKTRAEMIVLPMTCLMAMVVELVVLYFQLDVWLWARPSLLLAWAMCAALGWRSLVCLRTHVGMPALWAQGIWWVMWPMGLSMLADSLYVYLELGSSWRLALVCLPWAAALWLGLRRPQFIQRPLGECFAPVVPWLVRLYLLSLGWRMLFSLFLGGDVAPLPWLPLVNPLELMQLLTLALLLEWLRHDAWGRALARYHTRLLAVLVLVWISLVTLRGIHHFAGIGWNIGMLGSSLVQTSLTLLWSVLGMAAWVAGSRRGQRGLWLMGAALMGGVLIKLLLVDRQHLGNLLGIGSFIAYGLLCTVVGYLAPAPPRVKQEVRP